MIQINIFEEDYCNELKREVRSGVLSRFGETSFDYDEERELATNIQIEEDALVPILNCEKEDLFTAAKALYEVFPNLTGLQASYDPFWIHLSLVELYPYMIRVYPDIEKYKSQYVLNHYMMSKFTAYNLCGMWWSVYLTVRKKDDGTNDYALTRFLLNEHSQLTQSLVESQLFRCKQVTQGVIEFFLENPSECSADIIREALKYLNMLGSIKQLASLPSIYFKDEIKRQLPAIKEYLKTTSESKDKHEVFSLPLYNKIKSLIKKS